MAKSSDALVKRAAIHPNPPVATIASGEATAARRKKRVRAMPEGEVILRLAFHLLKHPRISKAITVSVDRHHLTSGGKTVFRIARCLREDGWTRIEAAGRSAWFGTYAKGRCRLTVTSKSIGGDIVAAAGKRRIRVECKKGKLAATSGNPENKLIHEAIGQLMTIEDYSDGDILIVAVPLTDHHRRKMIWQYRPLMRKCGIWIVLVGRDGTVEGMPRL